MRVVDFPQRLHRFGPIDGTHIGGNVLILALAMVFGDMGCAQAISDFAHTVGRLIAGEPCMSRIQANADIRLIQLIYQPNQQVDIAPCVRMIR